MMRLFTRYVSAVLSSRAVMFAVLSICITLFFLACGKKSDESVATTKLTDKESVESQLITTFGTSYNYKKPKNLALAARLEGASAIVTPNNNLKSTPDDAKAKSDGKAVEKNQAFNVTVSVLLKDEPNEIVATGAFLPGFLTALTNEQPNSEQYLIHARCLSQECDILIALLTVRDLQQKSVVGQVAMRFVNKKDKANKLTVKSGDPVSLDWVAPSTVENFFAAKKASVIEAKAARTGTPVQSAGQTGERQPVAPVVQPTQPTQPTAPASTTQQRGYPRTQTGDPQPYLCDMGECDE